MEVARRSFVAALAPSAGFGAILDASELPEGEKAALHTSVDAPNNCHEAKGCIAADHPSTSILHS